MTNDDLLDYVEKEPTDGDWELARILQSATERFYDQDDYSPIHLTGVFAQEIAKYRLKSIGMSARKLTFSRYQVMARNTAIYPFIGKNNVYPALGLVGETAETAEKLFGLIVNLITGSGRIAEDTKKAMRDDHGTPSDERKEGMAKELGDIIWYVSALAYELKFDLGEIALQNLQKLHSRKKRGQIGGSGDNR